MKRSAIGIATALFSLCIMQPVVFGGDSMYDEMYFVGVDGSLVLESIDGFAFDVTPISIDNVGYTIEYQDWGGAVPGGAGDPWVIGPTSTGFLGNDTSPGGSPLTEGFVLIVGADSSFQLSNFELCSDTSSNTAYPYSFTVEYDPDTHIYWLTGFHAPIPATISLLGGGLLGLLALRRRC